MMAAAGHWQPVVCGPGAGSACCHCRSFALGTDHSHGSHCCRGEEPPAPVAARAAPDGATSCVRWPPGPPRAAGRHHTVWRVSALRLRALSRALGTLTSQARPTARMAAMQAYTKSGSHHSRPQRAEDALRRAAGQESRQWSNAGSDTCHWVCQEGWLARWTAAVSGAGAFRVLHDPLTAPHCDHRVRGFCLASPWLLSVVKPSRQTPTPTHSLNPKP